MSHCCTVSGLLFHSAFPGAAHTKWNVVLWWCFFFSFLVLNIRELSQPHSKQCFKQSKSSMCSISRRESFNRIDWIYRFPSSFELISKKHFAHFDWNICQLTLFCTMSSCQVLDIWLSLHIVERMESVCVCVCVIIVEGKYAKGGCMHCMTQFIEHFHVFVAVSENSISRTRNCDGIQLANEWRKKLIQIDYSSTENAQKLIDSMVATKRTIIVLAINLTECGQSISSITYTFRILHYWAIVRHSTSWVVWKCRLSSGFMQTTWRTIEHKILKSDVLYLSVEFHCYRIACLHGWI